MVVREEGQRNIGLQREAKQEGSTFHITGNMIMQSGKGAMKETRLRCTHFQKVGHEKSRCFKIVGYPPNWNTRRSSAKGNYKGHPNSGGATGRAPHVAAVQEQTTCQLGLTMKQVNHLFNLFKEKQQEDQVTTQMSGPFTEEAHWTGPSHGQKDKFWERALRCIFIGYPQGQKGWKVYDVAQRISFVSRVAVFEEKTFPYVTQQLIIDEPKEVTKAFKHTDVLFNDEEDTRKDEERIINEGNEQPDNQAEDDRVIEEPNTLEQGNNLEQSDVEAANTRPDRTKKQPEYLKDYVCHATSNKPQRWMLTKQPLQVMAIPYQNTYRMTFILSLCLSSIHH
ncbi:hypothetical protein A4A49_22679 [Nicotiana attenuata]|uniref:Retroviral polymerase SH3-like domain-containing protein n=1 Tax=Nicotiana attenuata TaxID=49451 RepID=A0A1J6KAQ6_NICAT|nr:hypothetical protein A4A49_22679 [Nicotiana attenuata]